MKAPAEVKQLLRIMIVAASAMLGSFNNEKIMVFPNHGAASYLHNPWLHLRCGIQ